MSGVYYNDEFAACWLRELATMGKPGVPNLAFPRWLMGYPPAWLNGADLAMQSYRPSRRKS